jgi:hypothetical protein
MIRRATIFGIIAACIRLCSAVEADESSQSKLAREGIVLIKGGHWEPGLTLLRKAHGLAEESATTKHKPIKSFELNEASLAFGHVQVRNMLRDRPAMAQNITEEHEVFKWSKRQFAGETSGNRCYWTAAQPSLSVAMTITPTPDAPGEIRIATRRTVLGVSRPATFEELWSCAVFELSSLSHNREWLDLSRSVVDGTISRDEFVKKAFRIEFYCAQRTRRFYLDTFAEALRQTNTTSDPLLWFFHEAYLGDWERGLDFFHDRNQYPWSIFGNIYEKYQIEREVEMWLAAQKSLDMNSDGTEMKPVIERDKARKGDGKRTSKRRGKGDESNNKDRE